MAEKSIPHARPRLPGRFQLASDTASPIGLPSTAQTPIWVLENLGTWQAGPALALARRFGQPFRRIRQAIHLAAAEDEARVNGHRPALVISSGLGAGFRALSLRARYGCRVIHCSRVGGRLPAVALGYPFDVLVVPHKGDYSARVLGTLGPMSAVSPAMLTQAQRLWEERLAHLPRPRITILLGPAARFLPPREITARLKQVVSMVRERSGAILACALPGCDATSIASMEAAIGSCIHLLWRHGEPDENPMLGFIGCSDAVVTLGVSSNTLLEVSAADMPILSADSPEVLLRDSLSRRLVEGQYIRPLEDGFSPWPRAPLDEAGRIAGSIRRLMPI